MPREGGLRRSQRLQRLSLPLLPSLPSLPRVSSPAHPAEFGAQPSAEAATLRRSTRLSGLAQMTVCSAAPAHGLPRSTRSRRLSHLVQPETLVKHRRLSALLQDAGPPQLGSPSKLLPHGSPARYSPTSARRSHAARSPRPSPRNSSRNNSPARAALRRTSRRSLAQQHLALRSAEAARAVRLQAEMGSLRRLLGELARENAATRRQVAALRLDTAKVRADVGRLRGRMMRMLTPPSEKGCEPAAPPLP